MKIKHGKLSVALDRIVCVVGLCLWIWLWYEGLKWIYSCFVLTAFGG